MPDLSRLALWSQPDRLNPGTLAGGLNIQQRLFADGLSVGAGQKLLGDTSCASAAALKGKDEQAAAAQLVETTLAGMAVTNYAVDGGLRADSRLAAGQAWDPRAAQEDLTDMAAIEAAFTAAHQVPHNPGSLGGIGKLLRGNDFLADAAANGLVEVLPLGVVTPGTHASFEAYTRWQRLTDGELGLDYGTRSVLGYLLTEGDGWKAWDALPALQDTLEVQSLADSLAVYYRAQSSGKPPFDNPYTWLAAAKALEHRYGESLMTMVTRYLKGGTAPWSTDLVALLTAPGKLDFWTKTPPTGGTPEEDALMDASFVWLQARPGFTLDLDAMRARGRAFGAPTAPDGPGSALEIEAVLLLVAYTGLKRAASLLRRGAPAAEVARTATETRQVAAEITYGGALVGVLAALGA